MRHKTGEVLARVRRGEAIDVTEYGRTIARIVPVGDREPVPVLERLAAEGRLRRALRPGYLPPMLEGDGTDRLSETIAEMRDEQRW